MATVRYIVRDVDATIAFYMTHLGFELVQKFGPAMAILKRDDLDIWCAGPMSSAGQPMLDGEVPSPGGWARIVIATPDIDATRTRLIAAGVRMRGNVVAGPGGRQIVIEDPSGNAIEVFEARA